MRIFSWCKDQLILIINCYISSGLSYNIHIFYQTVKMVQKKGWCFHQPFHIISTQSKTIYLKLLLFKKVCQRLAQVIHITIEFGFERFPVFLAIFIVLSHLVFHLEVFLLKLRNSL